MINIFLEVVAQGCNMFNFRSADKMDSEVIGVSFGSPFCSREQKRRKIQSFACRLEGRRRTQFRRNYKWFYTIKLLGTWLCSRQIDKYLFQLKCGQRVPSNQQFPGSKLYLIIYNKLGEA